MVHLYLELTHYYTSTTGVFMYLSQRGLVISPQVSRVLTSEQTLMKAAVFNRSINTINAIEMHESTMCYFC